MTNNHLDARARRHVPQRDFAIASYSVDESGAWHGVNASGEAQTRGWRSGDSERADGAAGWVLATARAQQEAHVPQPQVATR